MSRILIFAALAAAAGLGAAEADTSKVSAAFGNTIVSTYPDGRTAEIWLKPDGTYTGEGRRHDLSNGRWSLRGDQICFHQSHPFMPFGSYCTRIPAATLGESWQGKAPTGEMTTRKIVSGVVHGG